MKKNVMKGEVKNIGKELEPFLTGQIRSAEERVPDFNKEETLYRFSGYEKRFPTYDELIEMGVSEYAIDNLMKIDIFPTTPYAVRAYVFSSNDFVIEIGEVEEARECLVNSLADWYLNE